MKGNTLKLLLLLLLWTTFFGCKKKTDDPDPVTPVTGEVVVISEDDWNNTLVTVDSVSYTFTFSQDPGLVSGNVMVTAADGGYLRKVTNVSASGGNTVVTTQFIAIADALGNAIASLTDSLTWSKALVANAWLAPGVQLVSPLKDGGDRFGYTFDYVFYDGDNNPATTDDQVKVEGYYNSSIGMESEFEAENFSINKIVFSFNVIESAGLQVTGDLKLAEVEKEQKIAELPFNTLIMMAGPVPITVQPVMELYAGIEGNVNTKLNYEVTQGATFRASMNYNGEEWSQSVTQNVSFNHDAPTVKTELSTKVYIKPLVKFRVYHILSPEINVSLAGTAEATQENFDINWEIKAGATANVGIKTEIWSSLLEDFNVDVFEKEATLADGTYSLMNTITDGRDGEQYLTIEIGEQTWLAQNMRHVVPGAAQPNPWPELLASLGLVYNWETAQQICPSGWHLPTDNEFMTLERELGMAEAYIGLTGARGNNVVVPKIVQSSWDIDPWGTQTWYADGGTTNSSGFSVLPAGYMEVTLTDTTTFNDYMEAEFWTSSTDANSSEWAWYRSLGEDFYFFNEPGKINRMTEFKASLMSVRCVKD